MGEMGGWTGNGNQALRITSDTSPLWTHPVLSPT